MELPETKMVSAILLHRDYGAVAFPIKVVPESLHSNYPIQICNGKKPTSSISVWTVFFEEQNWTGSELL